MLSSLALASGVLRRGRPARRPEPGRSLSPRPDGDQAAFTPRTAGPAPGGMADLRLSTSITSRVCAATSLIGPSPHQHGRRHAALVLLVPSHDCAIHGRAMLLQHGRRRECEHVQWSDTASRWTKKNCKVRPAVLSCQGRGSSSLIGRQHFGTRLQNGAGPRTISARSRAHRSRTRPSRRPRRGGLRTDSSTIRTRTLVCTVLASDYSRTPGDEGGGMDMFTRFLGNSRRNARCTPFPAASW